MSDIYNLVKEHEKTWRDQDEGRWLAGLIAEVGELANSLHGNHRHPPDLELKQIAAICLNWLDMIGHADGMIVALDSLRKIPWEYLCPMTCIVLDDLWPDDKGPLEQ